MTFLELDAWTRTPEWAGWFGLIVLIAAFGALAWWLFVSPLPRLSNRVLPTERMLRARRLIAATVLVSGLLMRVGALWDELWHRLNGAPFGADLLWPPHLLIYASFALTFLLVAYGLSVALRGHGSLRERFRREPLLGLLGLFSAYALAFIPVDVAWHVAIGPDLVAASPPHVFGALTGLGAPLAGAALGLSTAPAPAWRSLLHRPRAVDLLALGVVMLLGLSWLQLFTTGWEWPGAVSPGRPGWIYPASVAAIGAAFAHLALYSTRRVGAATAIALAGLAIHLLTVAVFRHYLPPGPALGAHLALLPPALALDAWYGLRARCAATPGCRLRLWMTRSRGAAMYAAVYFAVALPYIARVLTVTVPNLPGALAAPGLSPTAAVLSVAVGAPASWIASLVAARVGEWLAEAGRGQSPTDAPRPLTRFLPEIEAR